MSPESLRQLLSEPIEKLPFTTKFVEQSRLMNFATLQDVVDTNEGALMKSEGFNYTWFVELIGFFYKRNILDLLEDHKRFR
jgi:hypothetical protein